MPGWLKRKGELWGSTPSDIEQLLIGTGWHVERFMDLSEASRDIPGAVRGLPGERLVVAERTSSLEGLNATFPQ